MDPGGKFCYVSLTGDRQLKSFGIDENGLLTLIDTKATDSAPHDLATTR